ncbi:LamG-like jellyroll fold domain-containing protein [Psychromonas aquatilis]|uniref:LamG-like jellyroll fold domain-containing protein n=1 Tax=Psychromonas aquatilis TaxID=2005072 RepID=A0ABU9GQU9_9GAMM
MTIYINGVKSESKSVTFKPAKNVATDKFVIGGGSSNSDKNLDGSLDNIATWNTALTEAQIIERATQFGL